MKTILFTEACAEKNRKWKKNTASVLFKRFTAEYPLDLSLREKEKKNANISLVVLKRFRADDPFCLGLRGGK